MTRPTPHALPEDFAEFCRMAGKPREPFQVRAALLRKRGTSWVAPRQSGKSETLALVALDWGYRKSNQRILIISAGEEASKRLLAQVREIATGTPMLSGSVLDEQSSLLTLTNGSRIKAVPASERQIRGETADLLIIDEAALVSDDVALSAAFPTVAARPDARILLASSAGPANGFFYDQVQVGLRHSDYWDTHIWDLHDCWWITPSAFAAAEEAMSRQRLDAEFRNIFGGMSDTLLTHEIVDPIRLDYLQDRLDSTHGPARVWTGHDWAMSGPDYTAMVALGRFALRGKRVFGVRMTHTWPTGVPMHQVVAEIANSPAHYDVVNSERNGMGDPVTEQLFRAIYNRPLAMGGGNPRRMGYVVVQERGDLGEAPLRPRRRPPSETFTTTKRPIFTTAALKAAVYSNLRLLFERHRLLIPASAEDLYRELLLLKVDLTASGTEKIEARSGHDDLADSLALALYPYKDQNGAWRTRLSDYADPAVYPLAEPELPAAMERVGLIEGPGDLVIPRTPAWISMRGPEVTLPTNLDLVDPAMRDVRRRIREAISTHEQGGHHVG